MYVSESTYPSSVHFEVGFFNYFRDRKVAITSLTAGLYVDLDFRNFQVTGQENDDELYVIIYDNNGTPDGTATLKFYTINSTEHITIDNGAENYRGIYEHASALFNMFNNAVIKADRFSNDFFVRYGLRLVTGDVVGISSPILVRPNNGGAPKLYYRSPDDIQGGNYMLEADGFAGDLMYKMSRIGNDAELIDSLCIAVSRPLYRNTSDESYTDIIASNSESTPSHTTV